MSKFNLFDLVGSSSIRPSTGNVGASNEKSGDLLSQEGRSFDSMLKEARQKRSDFHDDAKNTRESGSSRKEDDSSTRSSEKPDRDSMRARSDDSRKADSPSDSDDSRVETKSTENETPTADDTDRDSADLQDKTFETEEPSSEDEADVLVADVEQLVLTETQGEVEISDEVTETVLSAASMESETGDGQTDGQSLEAMVPVEGAVVEETLSGEGTVPSESKPQEAKTAETVEETVEPGLAEPTEAVSSDVLEVADESTDPNGAGEAEVTTGTGPGVAASESTSEEENGQGDSGPESGEVVANEKTNDEDADSSSDDGQSSGQQQETEPVEQVKASAASTSVSTEAATPTPDMQAAAEVTATAPIVEPSSPTNVTTAETGVSSTARTDGTAASAGANQDSAVDTADRARFVERVARAFQSTGGNQTVRMRLHPEELGSLRLQVTMRGDGMHARIEAESAEARNILMDQLPALRERLAQQEIRLVRLDIDYSPGGFDGQNSQEANDSSSWNQRRDNQHTFGREQASTESQRESVSRSAPRESGAGSQIDLII